MKQLDKIVDKCLSNDSKDRYQSFEEIEENLINVWWTILFLLKLKVKIIIRKVTFNNILIISRNNDIIFLKKENNIFIL